ncbi:MAG: methionyl-tRNA formyltransferase [Thermodesulfobacteriota bacterium]
MNLSRVIFMGTPEFACPSLKGLIEAGEKVVSVYTQPDRPKGRGKKLTPSPVKELALSSHLPVFQPLTLKDPLIQDQLAEQHPDLLVVVAYGLILPQKVLEIPIWGAINVHASLLPKYRGAAPIQWAIIKGEKETGVTTMRLDAGLDTGDILLQEKEPVRDSDTARNLHDRLSPLGARLLLQTLPLLRKGSLVPQPQDSSLAVYAPPLKKAQGEICWDLPAYEIDCWIRGLFPWPGAFTFFQGKRLIIHKTGKDPYESHQSPGTIYSLAEGRLRIQTGKGSLVILEAQLEGHRRLSSEELIRGISIRSGDRLGR